MSRGIDRQNEPPTGPRPNASVSTLLVVPVLLLSLTGCVSKATANAQARAAYMAGQRDVLMQSRQEQAQGPSVNVVGPVKNSIIKWTPGMTLGRAIVMAVYEPSTDPKNIVIHRGDQDIPVDLKGLLAGQDVPLQVGDVVEIQQ